jgi:hypothetical protein
MVLIIIVVTEGGGGGGGNGGGGGGGGSSSSSSSSSGSSKRSMKFGPIQPPIRRVSGPLSLGLKPSGREADHSPPSSAEVKECVELYSTPPISLYGVVLMFKESTGTTLPLCLTKHYAMKTYWGSGGIAPRMLDLGTRWR